MTAALCAAAAAAVLLVPAIWNGYPLVFFDTGAFIDMAHRGTFVPERSVFYGWFVRYAGLGIGLWPVVAAQAIATVYVMTETARCLAPGLAPGRLLALVIALAVGTGLPWYAGQVLPDILAPLMVLALYLLTFHAGAIPRGRRWLLGAIAGLGAAAHAAHLLLAAGLAIVAVLAALARRWHGTPVRVVPALAVVAATTLAIYAANYARTGEVFFSRAGSAFVLGRLIQDGIVRRLLDETCPDAGYRLCAYKDRLPRTANDWLWAEDSPFWELGGFEGSEAESRRIVLDTLRRYPLTHAATALRAAAAQLVLFRTGDGIVPHVGLLLPVFGEMLPGSLPAYLDARQQRGLIDFAALNRLHLTVAFAALALLAAGTLGTAARGRNAEALALAYVLLALMGNALICGALSNPHDRYQSRLMWLAVFVPALLAAARGGRGLTRTA